MSKKYRDQVTLYAYLTTFLYKIKITGILYDIQ